jgi:hypothetical protein
VRNTFAFANNESIFIKYFYPFNEDVFLLVFMVKWKDFSCHFAWKLLTFPRETSFERVTLQGRCSGLLVSRKFKFHPLEFNAYQIIFLEVAPLLFQFKEI